MIIRDRKEVVITCPFCGAEYLPAEVYVPSAFFGKPEDIDKSLSGKIEAYDGTGLELKEKYTCDFCGKDFEVFADIKFKTQNIEQKAFDTVYTAPLYPNKISLFEGAVDDKDWRAGN